MDRARLSELRVCTSQAVNYLRGRLPPARTLNRPLNVFSVTSECRGMPALLRLPPRVGSSRYMSKNLHSERRISIRVIYIPPITVPDVFYVRMTVHRNRLEWIKPTDALNSSLIGMTTLHVPGSLSVNHQEFWAVRRLWYIICSCGDRMLPGVGWHWMCSVNYDIQVVATHADACVATTWISYRCVPCHPWCTHRTFLVIKKNFFSFPAAVNNSIKVGPLIFLLKMFVITENIMKLPLFYRKLCFALRHSYSR